MKNHFKKSKMILKTVTKIVKKNFKNDLKTDEKWLRNCQKNGTKTKRKWDGRYTSEIDAKNNTDAYFPLFLLRFQSPYNCWESERRKPKDSNNGIQSISKRSRVQRLLDS